MFKIFNKLFKGQCKVLNRVSQRLKGDKAAQSPSEIEVFINGKSVHVPPHYTVLQTLRSQGVTTPTFCYHERLSVSGNCRMCLVQIEGWPKLQIACAIPISKGIKIRTNSEVVLKSRESVLEFLLINHPLDCPICDQGGECDLQDLSIRFGNDRSRFTDIHFSGKRAVEDKNLGPLIRAEMTRCIQCTRCIRFGSHVCGLDVLGTAGRGTDMLVGTYVDKMFLSEVSGNIIDLCPVGALTAIPYMFKARPWEVIRTNSIDVTDATGTNIVLNHRFDRVLRVLPREHEEINQEWVSDKGRWAIDSLERQRLVTPMTRHGQYLVQTEWDCALNIASDMIANINPEKIVAVAGPHCSAETLVAAKDLVNSLGSEHTYVERSLDYTGSGIDLRAAYSMNVNMKDVIQANKILLVGTNPRFEAPILNVWIREAYKTNDCDIYVIGPPCEYNYHVNYIGCDVNSLNAAAAALQGAEKVLIFVGIAQLTKDDGAGIMCQLTKLGQCFNAPGWGSVNIITREASFGAALEAGWKPGALEALETVGPTLVISLGADEVFYEWSPSSACPVIYIGFQGDRCAEVASVILPGSAYTESGGTYINMEGRSQMAMPAVTMPGKARTDWKIIRALAEYCNICLFYDDLNALRCRMGQISPNFYYLGQYQDKVFPEIANQLIRSASGGTSGVIHVELRCLRDFYCTDVFTSNSRTMREAQKAVDAYNTSDYALN